MILALLLVACEGDEPAGDTTDNTPDSVQTVEDVYLQDTVDPLDMLWLLDPGFPAGFEALEAVRDTGYETLLLADTNWKMAFTTTDVQNPSHRGLIRGEHQSVFPSNDIWLPPRGTGPNRPFDALLAMFGERFDDNEEFFREDSNVYIMIMTNTRDRSEASVEDVLDVLATQIQDELSLTIRVSAIVAGSEDVQAFWQRSTQELGGETYVVGSWERAIQETYLYGVGQQREFVLTQTPVAAPRDVTVTFRERTTPMVLDEDYEYLATRNVIRFRNEVPEVGATVRISYETDTAPE